MVGRAKVERFFTNIARRRGALAGATLRMLNGLPAVVVEFGGTQLSCGPLVTETAFNEYILPRPTRDEHRSSIFYYHERGDSLEFMRIKLKSADASTGVVELDVMQLHGHWPSGSIE